MKKKLLILIALAVALIVGALVLKTSGLYSISAWQTADGGVWIFPLITIAAVIDSINPCAFSVLLLTVGFLISLGKDRKTILKIGAIYILGIFVAYVLIGLGILKALSFFGVPHFMSKVGAVIIIAFGAIDLFGEIFPNFPIRLSIVKHAHGAIARLMEKASFTTTFLLGALVGVSEFPCTGGPYLLILGLLHDKSTVWSGIGYLGYYNILFVLPLIVILLIASDKSLLDKVRSWKKSETSNMRFFGGALMIVLGLITLLF
jgi:cytochrome c-type biogenesis protein